MAQITYNKPLTQWGDPGSEPPAEFRTWLAGQKPPAGWFNWMWDACQKCFTNLAEYLNKTTIDDTQGSLITGPNPTGEADIKAQINRLANRIKAITGKDSVNDDPDITIAALKLEVESLSVQDPLGMAKPFFNTVLPARHLWVDGKTIGDGSSNASGRANADVFDLFSALWNATGLSIFESNGNPSARGASAAADWASHKRISLPNMVDNFLRGPGGVRQLGSYQGDAFQGHFHKLRDSQEGLSTSQMVVFCSGSFNAVSGGGAAHNAYLSVDVPLTDGVNGTPRTADETRPKSITCNWIMRY